MKTIRGLLIVLGLFAAFLQPVRAQGDAPLVLVMTVDGPIFPNTQQYIARGITTAEQRGAELLVLQLNTPGGDSESMFGIMQSIRASTVPVVIYVTPRGAGAFSAGAIITMSAHAAAMAPETAIGAASPVGASGEDLGATMKAKVTEAVKASLRSLVERRGQKAADLANAMIDDAKAVSATEAHDTGLVDFIANDLTDLLRQLDGFSVLMPEGPRTLNTKGAVVEQLPMSFIELLLNMLTDPNIIFLLTTIGVQAIIIEISSPGGWVAGFVGAICLALAAYGYGVLPINWFGIVFMLLAFVLFFLDVKAPTHGALTAAGIGSLIVGALVLFNTAATPSYLRISIPLVVAVSLITGVMFAIIVGFALRAQRAPVLMGKHSFVGQHGIARTDIAPTGQVQAGSELWSAELAADAKPIRSGEHVEIVAVTGLRLKVRKLK
jgi:membrane-bound serine protease (ClpP class)